MAPGEPTQKRKRGRPPNASKTAGTASDREREDGHPREPAGSSKSAEPSAAPKRRGRPRKSNDSVAQDEPPSAGQADQTEDAQAAPKKRGRPPKVRDAEHDEGDHSEVRPDKRRRADETAEAEDGQEEGEGRNKRTKLGKPQAPSPKERNATESASRPPRRNRQSDESPAQPSPQATNGQAEKTKGRPGRKPATSGEQPVENQTAEETSARRSRRERRSADDKPWWEAEISPSAAAPSKDAPAPPKPKRGRPSLTELSVSKAQNNASPSQTEQQGKKRPRGRPPRASNEGDAPAQTTSTKPTNPIKNHLNRRPSSEAEPALGEPPDSLATHRHLTTLTRHIPRATVASKWTPLDPPSITAVSNLLTEASLPILHRLRDRDTRHAQAQSVLRIFAARLRSKLVKGMPFPPASVPPPTSKQSKGRSGKTKGGHEVELDFEKTVDAIAGLEKALDPLLHSVVLLKAEKEREERALAREYEVLRKLEGNARAQVRGWREGRGRGREHVLVAGLGLHEGEGERVGEREGEVVVAAGRGGGAGEGGGLFKDLQEEELLTLGQQIGNHMESMKSNLGQIEGVLPAIAKARAALQGTLCEHLDPEQYEQVLLG